MKITNFYSNGYKGKEPPWKIFLFGYLLVIFIWTIFLELSRLISTDLVYFFLVTRLVYNFWLVVAFWNCAINASNRFFNILTRIMAIFISVDIFYTLNILIK
ncbi:hypothetical protein MCEMIHM37_00934 [Candidatus Methylopumilus planktonicus]